ncbi:hypothetical protein F4802DRAFT_593013 [Xylaria palmicola]|nr:hypothetical protein F4802DRAFT_593013 [Xylaria palmicola]
MQLKRKRSGSELSTSTTSTFDSPPRFGSFSPMDSGNFTFGANLPVSPLSRLGSKNAHFPHVPGRTMKRFRDNRPSQHEVHQRTLNMLYAAQRHQPRETRLEDHQQDDVPVAAQPGSSAACSSSHQTNLHSFWNLPSRPSAPPAACLPPTMVDAPTECEDCGQKLGGDDVDGMMDVDGVLGAEGTSCGACRKHVCSHCAITNLGEQRRCLSCAGTTTRTAGGDRALDSWARGMSDWLC